MTSPNGRIYVDPDGVSASGDAYYAHARIYRRHLEHIEGLRSRYGGSWGDDEMGRQFGQSFLAAMDALERIVKSGVMLLEYTSDGHRTSARNYRTADEDARDAGLLLLRRSEEDWVAPTLATAGAARGTLTSGATPPVPATLATEPDPLMHSAGTPLEQPTASHLTPATPALSGDGPWDIPSARVNGEPLSDGRRLVAFAPPSDGGSIHIDADRYDFVMPVAGSSVTYPDGRPIDGDGRQFFIVQDNPRIDPAAAGYRPLLVPYPVGGSRPVL